MDAILNAVPWQDWALGLLIVGLVAGWGFVRGWWVLGTRYDEMAKDRDYWRSMFFKGINLAETATDIAEETG